MIQITRGTIQVLTILCLAACEFVPSGEYKSDISSNVVFPAVDIDLNNAPDTLIVTNEIDINYKISGFDTNRSLEYRGYLENSNHVITLQGLEGTFHVGPISPRGYYVLVIEVVQNSGTGSLADKLGVEVILFQRRIVLNVDFDPADAPAITKVAPEAGRLKIEWMSYERINFAGYALTRYYNSAAVGSVSERFVFLNRNETTFVDSLYIGGTVTYSLSIITTGYAFSNGAASLYEYDYRPWQIVNTEELDDGLIKFYWKKTPFHQNVEKNEILFKNSIIKSPDPLTDTTLTIEAAFGGEMSIQIKAMNARAVYSEEFRYLHSDEPRIPYEDIQFGLANDSYYTIYFGTIRRYDLKTNQALSSRAFPDVYANFGYNQIATSLTGNTLWAYHEKNFYKLDPITLEILDVINAAVFIEDYSFINISSLAVSDNNRIAFRDRGKFMVYDLNDNSLLYSLSTSNSSPGLHGAKFSGDGNYIMAIYGGYFIRDLANSITTQFPHKLLTFDAVNQGQIYESDGPTASLRVLTLGDFSEIAGYTFSTSRSAFSIDPVTGWGISINQNGIELIDFVAGTTLSTIPITDNVGLTNFHDGVLYSSTGSHLNFK